MTIDDLIAQVFEDTEVGTREEQEHVASDLAKAFNMATNTKPQQGIKFLQRKTTYNNLGPPEFRTRSDYYRKGVEVLKEVISGRFTHQ